MKKRTQQHYKNAKQMLVGLQFSWVDFDPLEDGQISISTTGISHKNPIWRLTAPHVVKKYQQWIKTQQAFRWMITIECHLDDGNQKTVLPYELEAICKYNQLGDATDELIEQIYQQINIDHYRYFRFTAEILGTN